MSNSLKIAVIPGDGIGIEVTEQALRCFDVVTKRNGVRFETTEFPWGGGLYLRTGQVAPDDLAAELEGFDAVLFGAVGHPDVPDHIANRGLIIKIRQQTDQYVNLRPAKTLAGVPAPLADKTPIDLVIVRENTEGEYAGVGGRVHRGRPADIAIETSVFTRKGIERVVRFAFELALKRRKHVTSVSKANVLQYGFVLWDEVFASVAKEYPMVGTERQNADAMALQLVRRPSDYDVIVASNLFGDILSDLTAGLVGGLGVTASGNIDPTGRYPSMFEPVHGSAPDIAGKGIANPIAAFMSVVMMFEHLEDIGRLPQGRELAAKLTGAVESVTKAGRVLTPDFGGNATTRQVGDAIIEAFDQALA